MPFNWSFVFDFLCVWLLKRQSNFYPFKVFAEVAEKSTSIEGYQTHFIIGMPIDYTQSIALSILTGLKMPKYHLPTSDLLCTILEAHHETLIRTIDRTELPKADNNKLELTVGDDIELLIDEYKNFDLSEKNKSMISYRLLSSSELKRVHDQDFNYLRVFSEVGIFDSFRNSDDLFMKIKCKRKTIAPDVQRRTSLYVMLVIMILVLLFLFNLMFEVFYNPGLEIFIMLVFAGIFTHYCNRVFIVLNMVAFAAKRRYKFAVFITFVSGFFIYLAIFIWDLIDIIKSWLLDL